MCGHFCVRVCMRAYMYMIPKKAAVCLHNYIWIIMVERFVEERRQTLTIKDLIWNRTLCIYRCGAFGWGWNCSKMTSLQVMKSQKLARCQVWNYIQPSYKTAFQSFFSAWYCRINWHPVRHVKKPNKLDMKIYVLVLLQIGSTGH